MAAEPIALGPEDLREIYEQRTNLDAPTPEEFLGALAECLQAGTIVVRLGPDGKPRLYHPDHAPVSRAR